MADISHIAIEGAGEYDIKDGKARDDDSRQDDNLRQLWNKLAELQTVVDTANAEITAIKQELQAESGLIGTNIEDIAALKSGKVNKAGDTMTGSLVLDSTESYSDIKILRQYPEAPSGSNKAIIATNSDVTVISRRNYSDDSIRNQMTLYDDRTAFVRPVNVASGGTAGTSKTAATNNIGAYSLIGGTQIPANADLNSYKTIGNYYCPSNSTVATLLNRAPSPDAFRMTVSIGVGASGDMTTHPSYIRQDLFDFSGRTFTRVFVSSDWGPWLRHFDSAQTIPVANGGTGQTALVGNPSLMRAMFDTNLADAQYVPVFTSGWTDGGYVSPAQLRTMMAVPYMKTWTITTTATANAGQSFTPAQLGVPSNQSRAFDKNKDFLFLTNGDTNAQNVGIRRCQYQSNGSFWVEFSSAPTAGSIRFTCLLVQGV